MAFMFFEKRLNETNEGQRNSAEVAGGKYYANETVPNLPQSVSANSSTGAAFGGICFKRRTDTGL
jgi:hypothetical protein